MRMPHRSVLAVATLSLAACAADPTAPALSPRPVGPALSLAAGSNTVVVTESDIARQPENTAPTRSWVLYTRNAGTGTFRVGPATPPAGVGSIEFATPGGSDKVFLFNYDQVGTRLADINAIAYSTYRSTGTLQQVTALNIVVDQNGDGSGYTTLVYEPVYNASQGAVVDGQWQRWDAYAGGQAVWWSTKNIGGGICAFTCYATWSQIVAANPNAKIKEGIGFNQGSGNPALTAAADALTLGVGANETTWNFEPFRTPASADECKNGGWATLKSGDGSSFKNQGQCIQWVNTGK